MAPTTSTAQAIENTSNNTRRPQELSDQMYKFPSPGNAAHPVLQDSNVQKHDRSPGRASGIACSQASAWADEELAKRKSGINTWEVPTWNSLDNPENISEEQEIAAGKERGTKATRVFDDAWTNARNNL